jgi:hypothetical protein
LRRSSLQETTTDFFTIRENSVMKFVDLHHGPKHEERVCTDIGLMNTVAGDQFVSRNGWESVQESQVQVEVFGRVGKGSKFLASQGLAANQHLRWMLCKTTDQHPGVEVASDRRALPEGLSGGLGNPLGSAEKQTSPWV